MARPHGSFAPQSLRTRIAAVLADRKPRTAAELAQVIGEPVKRVRNACYCSVFDGRLASNRSGRIGEEARYTLPDDSIAPLSKASVRVPSSARQWFSV